MVGAKLKVLDLFSGIGGFSLGLERTNGFETVAFCEIEKFQRGILARHWPDTPCFDDVRTLDAAKLAADGITRVDVITGGFPCQDISCAGKRAGIEDGTRSGLWSEITRLTRELRPAFLIVENVADLLAGPGERPGGWFGRVLGDLASLGYDAEWENIPAAAMGAPHRRERIWIVAYPSEVNETSAYSEGIFRIAERLHAQPLQAGGSGVRFAQHASSDWLGGEPAICREDDGLSYGLVDHLTNALGNSVVPQIPELIGNAILKAIGSAAA